MKRRALGFLLLAAAVLWIPMVPLLAGQPPAFLRNLGFASGPRGTAPAWVLGIVVAVAYTGFTVRSSPLVQQTWRRVSPAKLVALLAAVAAAVVEEAFFRRLLMDRLLEMGVPAPGQILASGLGFGLAHGIWGLMAGRAVIGLRIMLATGILGAALATVYVVGDRSLAPPIVAHFIITATIQPGILYAAFSGRMPRPEPGWWRPTRT